MANKLFNTTDVAAIAAAIRSKNGSSDLYKVAEMAAAISAIPTGGSSEIELFDYLTLDGKRCDVEGGIVAGYTYELAVNNIRAVPATIHPFLIAYNLVSYTYWLSVVISGLRYYFGNNNGAQVGGESATWSDLQGEHVFKYNGADAKIYVDNGDFGTPQSYDNTVSNVNAQMLRLGGGVGGSNYFYGQIMGFKIWNGSNDLVHDYVPAAYKENGVVISAGMFDRVTNSFYAAETGAIATNTKINP